MFIKVKDLELRKMEFDETLASGTLDLGQDVKLKLPLRASGYAEVVKENRGAHLVVEDIRLVGKLSAQVESRCARCLEPVASTVAEEFDLIYRPLGVDTRGEEVSISRAETEIGYYQGDGLLLQDALKEQVLLALPARQICSEDCKGLCPHCGRNLNTETCDCVGAVTDSRWTALEDIRKKLER